MVQAVLAPFTTILILILILVYANNRPSVLAPSPLHIRKMSYNYKEVIEEKKYLKVLISLLYHRSFVHLIFTVSIIWGCLRYIEMERGTVFVIGYSCVLGVVSSCIYMAICHAICMNPGNVVLRIIQQEIEQTRMNGMSQLAYAVLGYLSMRNPILGFCGVALAWTAFQSLVSFHSSINYSHATLITSNTEWHRRLAKFRRFFGSSGSYLCISS